MSVTGVPDWLRSDGAPVPPDARAFLARLGEAVRSASVNQAGAQREYDRWDERQQRLEGPWGSLSEEPLDARRQGEDRLFWARLADARRRVREQFGAPPELLVRMPFQDPASVVELREKLALLWASTEAFYEIVHPPKG